MTIIDDRWRPSFDEIARSNYRVVGTVLTPLFQFTRLSWVSMNALRIDTENVAKCVIAKPVVIQRRVLRVRVVPNDRGGGGGGGVICTVCIYARCSNVGVYTNLRHSTRSLPRRRCCARNLAGTLPAHRNVNTINLGALSNFKQRIAVVGSILGRWQDGDLTNLFDRDVHISIDRYDAETANGALTSANVNPPSSDPA